MFYVGVELSDFAKIVNLWPWSVLFQISEKLRFKHS
jgi:hypothetical protein